MPVYLDHIAEANVRRQLEQFANVCGLECYQLFLLSSLQSTKGITSMGQARAPADELQWAIKRFSFGLDLRRAMTTKPEGSMSSGRVSICQEPLDS